MTKDMINNGVNSDDKSRIIQEYVPGKQLTLAHMVGSTSNVESALNSVITTFYNKLGFDTVSITKT